MDHGRPPGTHGEADPVTRCFTALGDRLVGTAYHILGHPEDAREAVQEAFVRCWRKRREIQGVRNVEAWVFTVVLNTAKDLRRRRRVRRADSLPTEGTMSVSGTQADPARVAEHRETLSRVRTAIHSLPERESEVFLLRQNGQLTFQAIAEALDAPLGTVKTRMRSALRRLRRAMDDAPRAMAAVRGGRR